MAQWLKYGANKIVQKKHTQGHKARTKAIAQVTDTKTDTRKRKKQSKDQKADRHKLNRNKEKQTVVVKCKNEMKNG